MSRTAIHIDALPQSHPAWSVLCQLYGSAECDPAGRALVITDESAGTIDVLPVVIAGLPYEAAEALEAPPPLPLALDLRSDGMIFDSDFRVVWRFVGGGGVSARPTVNGALATHNGRRHRIPQPLFGLMVAAQDLATPTEDEPKRLEAIARLKAAIPSDFDIDIDDVYLRELRIQYASAVSLELRPAGDSIEIDPVLFGRSAVEASSDGELIDQNEFALLTPQEHQRFATEGFRRSGRSKAAYSLGGSSYVYVDPALRPVLSMIREVQQADPETRKRFALDPRRAIREACGIKDEIQLDLLFVETEQFSQRVTGLDVWRKPVLPWIKPRPNSWLPEKLGLNVGGEAIELAPAEAASLSASIEKAISEGQPSVGFGEFEIPATQQALEGARAIAAVAEAAAKFEALGESEHQPPPPSDLKIFLTVRDNLEAVTLTQEVAHEQIAFVTPNLPACLRTSLKAHQRDGFAWLTELAERRVPGGLLADDMGLGKTLQALAALAWRWEAGNSGSRERRPSLIVAPTGLLSNWQDEVERHLAEGAFGAIELAYGANLKTIRETSSSGRDTALGRSTLDVSRWRDAGLVLTTYETLRDYHLSFARVPFAFVVFDEVQKAKNPASQITRAVKTLNAELKLALTGTPVENRLQDVWSITDVVWAGRLGSSQQFSRDFPETSIDKIRELNRSLIERGVDQTPPFMIRRLKKDRLEGLPPKSILSAKVPMPPAQASAYFDVVARALAADGSRSPGSMLATLQALRQISLHPDRPEHATGDLEAWARRSARLSAMLDVLDAIKASGEKALIFVEDLDMQGVVSALVASRYGLKRRPDRISGEVPGAKRQAIVRRFQEQGPGFDVLILSPKAGGVGLTITAANHVIHLSRWWNPAVEDQATDRVYRIGQNRPVTVHLPLAIHPDPTLGAASFDLRLDALLSRKRRLSEDLLLPVDGGDADLGGLFDEILGANRSDPPVEARTVETSSTNGSTRVADGQDPAKVQRSTLTLPERPPNSGRSRSDEFPSVQSWTARAGEPRKYAEYFGVFAGQNLLRVKIIDPYCMTSENRSSLALFLGEMGKVAGGIEAIHITAWSPTSRRMRERGVTETPEAARGDLNRILRQRLNPAPKVAFHFVHDSRTYRGDFHDRDIFVDAVGSFGPQTWYMSLTRGVDGLVDREKKCDVLLKRVESAPRTAPAPALT